VDAYLRESEEVFGGEPPKPLSERNFSGRLIVRTSPALHARLSMEATEQAPEQAATSPHSPLESGIAGDITASIS